MKDTAAHPYITSTKTINASHAAMKIGKILRMLDVIDAVTYQKFHAVIYADIKIVLDL